LHPSHSREITAAGFALQPKRSLGNVSLSEEENQISDKLTAMVAKIIITKPL